MQKNPHAAEYEIIHPQAIQPSTMSRTITFDRRGSGRLGQQTEIAEVEISVEDLAILAQDPEFSSLPDDDTLNFEYFEQAVQEDDRDDDPAVPGFAGKDKVKSVSVYLRHINNHY
jgi:hypothetical protein